MSAVPQSRIAVIIVGAGYAGVITANRLWGSLTPAERARVTIELVSPSDRFVHRIRLHEHAAGAADAVLPLASMIPEAVRVRLGTAVHIDTARRTIRVRTAVSEQEVTYDRLVYAVGSRPAMGVRGATEHALPVGDLAGATAIRDRVRGDGAARVIVVGAGRRGSRPPPSSPRHTRVRP